MKTRKSISAILLLVAFALFAGSCGIRTAKIDGFQVHLGEAVESGTQIKSECDVSALSAQIKGNKTYLYGQAKETDFAVAARLGFDKNTFTQINGGTGRSYVAESENPGEVKRLEIDRYGGFEYRSGYKETATEYPYTKEQVVEMGKNVLKDCGLWDNSFGLTGINETKNYDPATDDAPVLIGMGVNFYRKAPDGRDIYNEFICIEINGDGKVTEIICNVRNYGAKQDAELIPLAEAYEKADISRALVGLNAEPSELKFDKVDIVYWSEQNADGEYILQPLYRFSGTTASGEEFFTTVQANKLS